MKIGDSNSQIAARHDLGDRGASRGEFEHSNPTYQSNQYSAPCLGIEPNIRAALT